MRFWFLKKVAHLLVRQTFFVYDAAFQINSIKNRSDDQNENLFSDLFLGKKNYNYARTTTKKIKILQNYKRNRRLVH